MGGYSRLGHVRLITAVPDATCLLLQGSELRSPDGLTLPCAGVACSALPLSLGGTERKARMWSRHFMSRTPQQPVELGSGEEMCDTSPPLLPHSFPPAHSSVAVLSQSFPMIMGGALVSYNCTQYFSMCQTFCIEPFGQTKTYELDLMEIMGISYIQKTFV